MNFSANSEHEMTKCEDTLRNITAADSKLKFEGFKTRTIT